MSTKCRNMPSDVPSGTSHDEYRRVCWRISYWLDGRVIFHLSLRGFRPKVRVGVNQIWDGTLVIEKGGSANTWAGGVGKIWLLSVEHVWHVPTASGLHSVRFGRPSTNSGHSSAEHVGRDHPAERRCPLAGATYVVLAFRATSSSFI